MPYVNCSECGVRSFALAPWSTVDRCPTCETPLRVPRQSVAADPAEHPLWSRQIRPDDDRRSQGVVEAG